MNRILVDSSEKRFLVNKGIIKVAVKSALFFIKKDNFKVEVFLIDESRMKKLNRDWRGKDKSTNVLAFPEPAWPSAVKSKIRSAGEVYLSPDYIKKHKESLPALAIHGTLHLFGYDHKKKNDRIKMEKLEKNIYALCYNFDKANTGLNK